MKKYFLTTAIIMATFGAFGADGMITGGAGTCTVDVLGVSDNNAIANTIATWSLESYECPAGQYLNITEDTIECTECPTGSYCPGGTYTVESETNGATTCPTDYTTDGTGASEQTQCFINCETQCVQQTCPTHSENCTHITSTSTGRQYYGKTCDAVASSCKMNFDCATGYNKQEITETDISQAFYAVVGSVEGIDVLPFICLPTGNVDMVGTGACELFEPGTYALVTLDSRNSAFPILKMFKFQRAYNTVSPFDYPGAYTKTYDYDNSITDSDTHTVTVIPADTQIESTDEFLHLYYKLTEVGFATTETYELMLKLMNSEDVDMGDLVKISQTFETIKITDKPWIVVDKFFFVGKLTKPKKMSEVLQDEMDGGVFYLADIMQEMYANTIPNIYGDMNFAACGPNLINIGWNPDNGESEIQNMCYYDGTIDVPADPVKPGYTFTGWKLLEETTTE